MKIAINGAEIGEAVCAGRIEALRHENPWMSDEDLKKRAADELVRHNIVRAEARRRFPEVSDTVVNAELERLKKRYPSEDEFRKVCRNSGVTEEQIKEDMRDSARINLLVRELSKDIPPAPPQIVEEYYRRDTEVSLRPMEIHAGHIVKKPDPRAPLKTFNEMMEIRKKALDGADFAALADKHSSCRDKGGDLGWFSPGKMVEDFEVVVFSMKKGEVSPVFKTPFGYHVAKVYDARPPRKLALEECAAAIESRINQKAQEHAVDEWVKKAREGADVKIME